MRKLATLTAVAALAVFGFAGGAYGGPLGAPSGPNCSNPNSSYFVTWGAIDEEEKYAIAIECVDPGTGEVTDEVSFGTSDCFVAATAEEPEEGVEGVTCSGLTDTQIDILHSFFAAASGDLCTARIRGLHSGPGKGRQDKTNHAEASVGCPNFP